MDSAQKAMLLELADYLDVLPPERFDFRSWVGGDWQGNEDLSCGTTACAGGHATVLPSFRKRGLSLRRFPGKGATGGYPYHEPSGTQDEYALARVLDITLEQARVLFIPGVWLEDEDGDYIRGADDEPVVAPSGDATPKEMADHIRHMLNFIPVTIETGV